MTISLGRRRRRRGMVLVLVLIVIAILSLSGYTFSSLMWSEHKAADLALRQAQARALAESGVEAARVFLAQQAAEQLQTGGWYDNPAEFQGAGVVDDDRPSRRGRFTIIAPRIEGGVRAGLRYGLENESAKLNLNMVLKAEQASAGAGRTMLMTLPGMTEDVADAILDWIDSDSETRELGAEADYYTAQVPPYSPRNALPQTLEELLLVRGVTPALLLGGDANRNGLVDPGESTDGLIEGSQYYDESAAGGWAGYLTLYSAQSATRPDGQPKVKLNQQDLQQLYNDLQTVIDPEQAAFIVAYRQYGSSSSSGGGGSGGGTNEQAPPAAGGYQPDFSQPAKTNIANLLDLVGASVSVSAGGRSQTLPSPFRNEPSAMSDYLPKLFENTTVETGKTVPGKININQAPRAVLAAIPGMTEDVLESIVGQREEDPTVPRPEHDCEAWPLVEGIVPLETMKQMMPYITTGGSVYRTMVVGFFDGGGPAARVEAVIDATVSPPRVLLWREMTQLGRGYSLEDLGAESGAATGQNSDQ